MVGVCRIWDFPLYFQFNKRLKLLEPEKKDVELFPAVGPLNMNVVDESSPKRWLWTREAVTQFCFKELHVETCND